MDKEWDWKDVWAFPKKEEDTVIKIKITPSTMKVIRGIKLEAMKIIKSIKEDGLSI